MAALLWASVSSKQSGYESLLCPLVAEACINVCPKNPHNFDVDNVRVCKLIGGSVHDTTVVKGMVFKRESEGIIKRIENAKVAVFAQGPADFLPGTIECGSFSVAGVDTNTTETKGTILIKSAEELESYASSEEAKLESYIKVEKTTKQPCAKWSSGCRISYRLGQKSS